MKNLFFTLVFVFGISAFANAHAPKKVIATYDANTNELVVEVVHKVKDTKTHYIDKIEVTIGEEVITKTYTVQTTLQNQKVKIKLTEAPAKGTEIVVSANCNKLGSKKTKIEVE